MQRGSAKHSVKGGLAFLWEMRCSTPYSSAPNEPIKMALGTRDYVVEATPPANFCPPTLVRLPPWKGVKYNLSVRPLFLFVFPTTSRVHTRVGRFLRSMRQMTSFRC